MKRDGYSCILTGVQGVAHPSPDQNTPLFYLEACHILRRAVGKFDDKDHNSDSVGHILPGNTTLEAD